MTPDWTIYECAYIIGFLCAIFVIMALGYGAWLLGKWMLDKAIEHSMKPKLPKKTKWIKSRFTFIQQLKWDYRNYMAYKDYAKKQRGRRNHD